MAILGSYRVSFGFYLPVLRDYHLGTQTVKAKSYCCAILGSSLPGVVALLAGAVDLPRVRDTVTAAKLLSPIIRSVVAYSLLTPDDQARYSSNTTVLESSPWTSFQCAEERDGDC